MMSAGDFREMDSWIFMDVSVGGFVEWLMIRWMAPWHPARTQIEVLLAASSLERTCWSRDHRNMG